MLIILFINNLYYTFKIHHNKYFPDILIMIVLMYFYNNFLYEILLLFKVYNFILYQLIIKFIYLIFNI